jgi:hypothetical protein
VRGNAARKERTTMATTRKKSPAKKKKKAAPRARKSAAKKSAAKKTSAKRGSGKRELIENAAGKSYAKRTGEGRFKEMDQQKRSLASDVRKKAKTKTRSGYGDRGDR